MSLIPLIAGIGALVWADILFWVGLYTVVARARLGAGRSAAVVAAGPPWLLFRPCAGEEPDLARCLTSVAQSRCSHPLRVIVGVHRADDPARPIAARACAELAAAGIPAEVRVLAHDGANDKAGMMARLLAEVGESHTLFVNADSNVDLAGFDLDALVGALEGDPRRGAVWVPPVETCDHPRLGNRAQTAVLSGSLHAFSLLCAVDRRGLVGKLFAARIAALTRDDGLDRLGDFLGEDMELSRRLTARGFEVAPLPAVVTARAAPKSMSATVDRHARWLLVIRAQRPALLLSFPVLFCCTLPTLALAGVALAHAAWLGTAGIAFALLSRLVVGWGARRFAQSRFDPWRGTVDLVLADLVLARAWWRAITRAEVVWRGRRLRLDREGRLQVASGR